MAEVLCPWRPRCVVAASGGVAPSGGVSRGRGVVPVVSEVCLGRFRRCGPFRGCVVTDVWPRCVVAASGGVAPSGGVTDVWPRCGRGVTDVWPRCVGRGVWCVRGVS